MFRPNMANEITDMSCDLTITVHVSDHCTSFAEELTLYWDICLVICSTGVLNWFAYIYSSVQRYSLSGHVI